MGGSDRDPVHPAGMRFLVGGRQLCPRPDAAPDDKGSTTAPEQEVHRAREHLARLVKARQTRVAEIRRRVRRGEYRVSDEELADRLIECRFCQAVRHMWPHYR